MGNNKAYQRQDLEKRHIEAVLFGLMKELQKLAPQPHTAEDHDAHITVESAADDEENTNYIEMLVRQNTQSPLGGAFDTAAIGVEWGALIERISAYIQTQPKAAPAPAPRAIKMGQRKSISAAFNTSGLHAEMMSSYLRDLPRRLGLERFVSDYNRKLYAVRKHAALGLAA